MCPDFAVRHYHSAVVFSFKLHRTQTNSCNFSPVGANTHAVTRAVRTLEDSDHSSHNARHIIFKSKTNGYTCGAKITIKLRSVTSKIIGITHTTQPTTKARRSTGIMPSK